MKKYFFFDIDGTLTYPTKAEIPADTLQVIAQLKQAGHFVAVATGRPKHAAEEFAQQIGIENYVCNGGNTLVVDNNIIEDAPLDLHEERKILSYMLKHGYPMAVSIQDGYEIMTHDTTACEAIKKMFPMIQIIKINKEDYMKLEHIKRIYLMIEQQLDDDLPPLKKLVASRYEPTHVTVEPDDKYGGIQRLMSILKEPIDNIVVFGDGVNDIRMFEHAPMSIAMGNSIEELKQIASFVTKSSDEDGIGYACRYHGWL